MSHLYTRIPLSNQKEQITNTIALYGVKDSETQRIHDV